MQPTGATDQGTLLRGSIVASAISLLCVSAIAVYLRREQLMLFLLGGLFVAHALALFVLQRPSAAPLTANVWIGSLGLLVSLVLIPVTVLALAFLDTYVPLLFAIIYAACQLVSVVQGVKWKKSASTVTEAGSKENAPP